MSDLQADPSDDEVAAVVDKVAFARTAADRRRLSCVE
jgi:hypothetical protein